MASSDSSFVRTSLIISNSTDFVSVRAFSWSLACCLFYRGHECCLCCIAEVLRWLSGEAAVGLRLLDPRSCFDSDYMAASRVHGAPRACVGRSRKVKLVGWSTDGLLGYCCRWAECGLGERERGTSGECAISGLLRTGVIYVKALLVFGDTAI